MYIFQSKLKGHSSFFIFHVNKANELTSISYCDGHSIDKGRKIKDSTTHIKGVTTFKLKTPIEYNKDFAQNFIENNSKNKSKKDFHNKFINNAIQAVDIDYSKTTHSIPTKIQKRGNCVFKSTSLLARFISHQKSPETMDYGFDEASQKPTGAGYDEYKKFKDGLTKNALDSIIKMKEKISLESDPLSEHLKKENEGIMKMVEIHNKKNYRKMISLEKNFIKKLIMHYYRGTEIHLRLSEVETKLSKINLPAFHSLQGTFQILQKILLVNYKLCLLYQFKFYKLIS